MTAADLPQPMPRFGPQRRDRPVLAVGETKYHGEPVAAVAAETRDAAEEAAGLVRVECEELPAVHTLAAALAADAPLVQDPALRPDDPLAGTNVLREHRYGWGDVDAATRERRRRRRGHVHASRWSPSSRSSRTRSWPRPTATASRSGARSSTRTGCSA